MTEQEGPDVQSARRRARREFVRAHHPDAGGSHDHFITGLANFDPGRHPAAPSGTKVTVVPRQTWPVSLTTVLLRRLRRRYDKPRVR